MFEKAELDYLLNLLKRKQLASDFILKHKAKYSADAVERAQKTKDLTTSIISKLTKKGSSEDRSLEDRLKALEAWRSQTELVIKKLVSYHEGI